MIPIWINSGNMKIEKKFYQQCRMLMNNTYLFYTLMKKQCIFLFTYKFPKRYFYNPFILCVNTIIVFRAFYRAIMSSSSVPIVPRVNLCPTRIFFFFCKCSLCTSCMNLHILIWIYLWKFVRLHSPSKIGFNSLIFLLFL